jgi:hypothetical protein
MDGMDAKRLELYDLLKPKLDEEPARRLVAALPAEPDSLVTKALLESTLDARLAEQTDKLTWRMIAVMGAWTITGVSLFGLMSQLFR